MPRYHYHHRRPYYLPCSPMSLRRFFSLSSSFDAGNSTQNAPPPPTYSSSTTPSPTYASNVPTATVHNRDFNERVRTWSASVPSDTSSILSNSRALLDPEENSLSTDRTSVSGIPPESVSFRYRKYAMAHCCFEITDCFSILPNLYRRRRDPVRKTHKPHHSISRMHHDEGRGASLHSCLS